MYYANFSFDLAIDWANLIGKYLSSLGKLDDIVTPEKGFETQL